MENEDMTGFREFHNSLKDMMLHLDCFGFPGYRKG